MAAEDFVQRFDLQAQNVVEIMELIEVLGNEIGQSTATVMAAKQPISIIQALHKCPVILPYITLQSNFTPV